MSKYPPLRLAMLSSLADLKVQLKADPDFLKSDECPYDQETVDLLTELLTAETVEVVIEKQVGGGPKQRGRPSKDVKLSEEDQQAVLDGIKKTMEELDAMSAKEGLETNERIQIAKTRTALMKELLALQERHYSLMRTQEFIENVIGILSDLGDEAMREKMLARLEQFR